MKYLAGKRILVTQYALVQFSGSEIVTLEIVTNLIKAGAHVTLYTLRFDDPIAHFFRQLPSRSLKIVARTDVKMSFSNFDYVWVHHQILPVSMVSELSQNISLPLVIFNHMSSYIPIEQPYLFNLEVSIGTCSTFNSQETLDNLQPFFDTPVQYSMSLLPNPAPDQFISHKRLSKDVNQEPRKVLFISNHLPEELAKLYELLTTNNIQVDIIGRPHREEIISPTILENYDVIVSIGKTVQYCLVTGTPIYCYDYFGGPGYLSSKNYTKAAYYNFSGRGFRKKTPEVLYTEIVRDYKKALRYQLKNVMSFKDQYNLDNYIQQLLELKPRIFKPLSIQQVKSYIAAQLLVSQYVNDSYNSIRNAASHSATTNRLVETIQELELNILEKDSEITTLRKMFTYRAIRRVSVIGKKIIKLFRT